MSGTRARILTACAKAEQSASPVLLGGGYAVEADAIEAAADASVSSEPMFVYTLVTPEGERFGGCTSVDEFVEFLARFDASHAVPVELAW